MNCPYCKNEMEKGLIQSPQEITFIKGDKRKFAEASFLNEDSVILSERSFIRGSATIAYLCRNCEKIIIDYKDGKNDLNKE